MLRSIEESVPQTPKIVSSTKRLNFGLPAAFLCIAIYSLFPTLIPVILEFTGFPITSRFWAEALLLFGFLLLCFSKFAVGLETFALLTIITLLALGVSVQGLVYGIEVSVTNRNWLWMFLQILVIYTIFISFRSLRNGHYGNLLLGWLIGTHLVLLILETVLALAGLQPELARIFNGSELSPFYRTDLPSLAGYVFSGITGLNSLAFGAQHASIAAVISLIYFIPWLTAERLNVANFMGILFALIAWFFSFTVTSLICFGLVVVYSAFLVGNSLLNKLWIKAVLCSSALAIIAAPQFFLGWKIKSASAWAEYVNAFSNPFQQIAKMDSTSLLAGVGKIAGGVESSGYYFASHDFGWGVEIVRHGIPVVTLVAVSLFLIYWLTARSISISKSPSGLFRSAAVSLTLAASLIHYPTIYCGGFRQLFILATALCLVGLRETRNVSP